MYLAVIQYVHKYYTAYNSSTTQTKHLCVPSAEKVQPVQRQSTRHINSGVKFFLNVHVQYYFYTHSSTIQLKSRTGRSTSSS